MPGPRFGVPVDACETIGNVLHRYRLPAGTDIDAFTATATAHLQQVRRTLTGWPRADLELTAEFWFDPTTEAQLVTIEATEEYLPAWEDLPGVEAYGWNTPDGEVVASDVWDERRAAWTRAVAHGGARRWVLPAEHVSAC